MESERPPAYLLSHEIAEHPNVAAPLNDITKKVKELRACGLPDEKVQDVATRMFSLKDEVDDHEQVDRAPDPDEILIYSLPEEYRRANWQ